MKTPFSIFAIFMAIITTNCFANMKLDCVALYGTINATAAANVASYVEIKDSEMDHVTTDKLRDYYNYYLTKTTLRSVDILDNMLELIEHPELRKSFTLSAEELERASQRASRTQDKTREQLISKIQGNAIARTKLRSALYQSYEKHNCNDALGKELIVLKNIKY